MNSDKVITDAQILRWIRDNLDWDGHGYWFPELCVKELSGESCPEPTMKEFRASLSKIIQTTSR